MFAPVRFASQFAVRVALEAAVTQLTRRAAQTDASRAAPSPRARVRDVAPANTLGALALPARALATPRVTSADVDRGFDRARRATAADWKARFKEGTAAHAAHQRLGAPEAVAPATWYRAYWSERCLQLAARVLVAMHGDAAPPLAVVLERVKQQSRAGDVDSVAGRSTRHRGMGFAELAEAERLHPTLRPGTAIHVKLSIDENNPYATDDDFHHWVVYRGDGRFSDSLVGEDVSGAEVDAELQAWVARAFSSGRYAHHHRDERFVARNGAGGLRRGVPAPGLQPRITATYDVLAAPR